MDDGRMDEALPSGSSSVGEAASARGAGSYNEEEDLFYIPERRPSLDLGQEQNPADEGHWPFLEQAVSPAQSYDSMRSDDLYQSEEMGDEGDDSGRITGVHLERSDSFSSCYSVDSDDCQLIRKKQSKAEDAPKMAETREPVPEPEFHKHPSITVAFTFKAICDILKRLSEEELRTFKASLWKRYPRSFHAPLQSLDLVDLVDRLLECYDLRVALQITKILLEEMGRKKLVEHLKTLCLRNEVRYNLCAQLRRQYGDQCENWGTHEDRRSIDSVFTDLHISSTCNNGPNTEHEVRNIGKLHTNRSQGKVVRPADVLSADMTASLHAQLVLTSGMAGTGKTTVVRKVIMDWAEGRSHQHVSFLFPLPFRELNAFQDSAVSLVDIIQTLYPDTKQLRDEDYRSSSCTIMLVCDGLDEYRGALDFHDTVLHSDHASPAPLQVLVVNLLRGRLLHRGLVWVTTRPPLRRCVPWDMHFVETELLGFDGSQREEYFRKRFKDRDPAEKVLACLGSHRTLQIMCHLPLFCSLLGDEFGRAFQVGGPEAQLPGRITGVYTKMLLMLLRSRKFRVSGGDVQREREFLLGLGKLAFSWLQQGLVKSDGKDLGALADEAVLGSGLCTHFIVEPFVLYREKAVSFLHLTVQEYLAALYAFLTFRSEGRDVLAKQQQARWGKLKGKATLDVYRSAVESCLARDDGHMDLFLRFLVGMAAEANQKLLQPLCAASAPWVPIADDVAALIRDTLRDNRSPDRNAYLQRCLEELGV